MPGYVVGGKTGTAQVVGPDGRYMKHTNNASFMAAFPMNDPQYVIYVLVLQPHADATTGGFTTGGQIAAPTVGRIIARIGPMLGVLPAAGDELAALGCLADRADEPAAAAWPDGIGARTAAAAGGQPVCLYAAGREAAGIGGADAVCGPMRAAFGIAHDDCPGAAWTSALWRRFIRTVQMRPRCGI